MTDSSLKEYLNTAGRYPLLSPEQEIQLSRQVQAMREVEGITDPTPQQRRIIKRGMKARNAIVNANLRLVVHIAKRYLRRLNGGHMELMDIIQEGNIGLHRAAELFDGTKGYKFSTYAYWWIRQAITRAIDTQERAIRVPQHGLEKLYKAVKMQEQFTKENNRSASIAELAEMMEVSAEELTMLMARNVAPRSLDQLAKEDGTPLIDLIADERCLGSDYDAAEQTERSEQLSLAFFHMTDEDRELISKRYGIGCDGEHAYREIANQHGVSRETIKLRIKKAERKLRFMLQSSASTMSAASA
jgi:RNA polymerase sigma factor (sigma-70 family)